MFLVVNWLLVQRPPSVTPRCRAAPAPQPEDTWVGRHAALSESMAGNESSLLDFLRSFWPKVAYALGRQTSQAARYDPIKKEE